MLSDFGYRLWHYLKCIVILRQELSAREKKQFKYIGFGSIVQKPVTLHSGQDGISIGNNTTILHSSRLQTYKIPGYPDPEIMIGDGCYISFHFTALCAANQNAEGRLNIGNRVLIASHVIVTNENHGMDPESDVPYMDQPLTSHNVTIEDDCWLGEKVCVLPGVTIGNHSVVGAGSVVAKSIPAYSIAVGNPARVIKQYDFERHCWVNI